MSLGNIARIRHPENCNINLKDLKFMRDVQKEQSFCQVKIVKHEDQVCALKIIHKKMIPPGNFEEEYNRLQNEIKILYSLNHPSIIKLYFQEENQDDILMLMEYGGLRLVNSYKRNKLPEDQIKDLLRQIVKGLKEIHENGYIHRDISPQNILVNRDKQVKIVDFGFADLTGGRSTRLGTLIYMAPEISGVNNYNYKIDIWSLGIIAYEMFHQKHPFCQKSNFNQTLFLQNRNKLHYEISPELSPDASDFLRKMIVLNPQKRANADQLLKHKFLKENNEQQSSFFDNLNETQKIERKTQKNNLYLRQRQQKSQQPQRSFKSSIDQQQRQLKRSINQIFASLHHQKDLFSQLIKTYQDVLKKGMPKRT